jgi:uncharacterized membrane protein YqjE
VSATQPANPIETGRAIADHVARLIRLEFELKTVELKEKAARAGFAAGLGLLALLLAPLLVAFALAAVAAALATVLPVWLAIVIVFILLLALVGGLAGASAALISTSKKERSGDEH